MEGWDKKLACYNKQQTGQKTIKSRVVVIALTQAGWSQEIVWKGEQRN